MKCSIVVFALVFMATQAQAAICASKDAGGNVVSVAFGNATCSGIVSPPGGSVEVATQADLASYGRWGIDTSGTFGVTAGDPAVSVTSTANGAALNGTYRTDFAFQDILDREFTYCTNHANVFPDGSVTLNVPDVSGVLHTFPTCAELGLFAGALNKLRLLRWAGWYASFSGNPIVLPAATITIP